MIEKFLEASNFTPEEQTLLNEILNANADPIGINMFELLNEGLQQVLAHDRGEIELPHRTWEHTFPDCPPCWCMQDNDCIHKDKCVVQISQDNECRVGVPSKHISFYEGRIIDELNAIGCTSFRMSPGESRKIL